MKNVHVLPTDKPSRFFNTNTGEYHFREHYVPDTILTCKNHNIYITSGEEIKGGDWVLFSLSGLTEIVKVTTIMDNAFNSKRGIGYGLEYCSKIVLTTDQDLFKEGVQPIDDEFLEWFGNNLRCHKVNVELIENDRFFVSADIKTPYYKIIIPTQKDNDPSKVEQLPTKWFKTEEIATWVGTSDDGGRGKLIVLHQCGENKEELISQLKTLINGIESDFEWFTQ